MAIGDAFSSDFLSLIVQKQKADADRAQQEKLTLADNAIRLDSERRKDRRFELQLEDKRNQDAFGGRMAIEQMKEQGRQTRAQEKNALTEALKSRGMDIKDIAEGRRSAWDEVRGRKTDAQTGFITATTDPTVANIESRTNLNEETARLRHRQGDTEAETTKKVQGQVALLSVQLQTAKLTQPERVAYYMKRNQMMDSRMRWGDEDRAADRAHMRFVEAMGYQDAERRERAMRNAFVKFLETTDAFGDKPSVENVTKAQLYVGHMLNEMKHLAPTVFAEFDKNRAAVTPAEGSEQAQTGNAGVPAFGAAPPKVAAEPTPGAPEAPWEKDTAMNSAIRGAMGTRHTGPSTDEVVGEDEVGLLGDAGQALLQKVKQANEITGSASVDAN